MMFPVWVFDAIDPIVYIYDEAYICICYMIWYRYDVCMDDCCSVLKWDKIKRRVHVGEP